MHHDALLQVLLLSIVVKSTLIFSWNLFFRVVPNFSFRSTMTHFSCIEKLFSFHFLPLRSRIQSHFQISHALDTLKLHHFPCPARSTRTKSFAGKLTNSTLTDQLCILEWRCRSLGPSGLSRFIFSLRDSLESSFRVVSKLTENLQSMVVLDRMRVCRHEFVVWSSANQSLVVMRWFGKVMQPADGHVTALGHSLIVSL